MTIPILDKITFSSGFWTLTAVLVVLVFFGIWFYITLFKSSENKHLRRLFTVLRFLALCLLVAMILDMRLTFSHWRDEIPETLFLYDLSASMDSAWTPESVEAFHRHALTQRLDNETRLIRFGGGEYPQKLRRSPGIDAFNKPITDFESLITGVWDIHGSQPDQFIFLTDGRNLKGLETEQIAFPPDVNWLVVGVGDTLTDGRFTVVEWDTPDPAVQGDTAEIKARILYDGLASREGVFQLMNGEDLLTESENVRMEEGSARDVSLPFVFLQEGIYFLTLRFKDEMGHDFPVKGFTRLTVRPREYAVVIFSGPDPDVRFIRDHLQMTENYAFYSPDAWEKNHPGDTPDLLLIGPGESSGHELYEKVPAIVVRGCTGGEGEDVSRFQVTEVLPFTHLADRAVINREIWSRFPPVKIVADSDGLPVVTDENREISVITYREEDRRLIFNGCGFWRWAWAGYGTERQGAWKRLTDQCARFLLSPQPEWAWLENPREPVYAGFSHDIPVIKGTSVAPGFADGRLSLKDSTGSLVWNSSLKTLYQPVTPFRIPGVDAGRYTAVLEVFYQGEKVESDSVTLVVNPPDPERRLTGCDMKTLRRWAVAHNGHALHLNRWDKGEQILRFDEKYKRQVIHIDFRRNIIWILILLILLTTEWIIRKSAGSE